MLGALQLMRRAVSSTTSRTQSLSNPWGRRLITSFTDIPTVDISSLVDNGSLQEQQKAGNELHTACVEVGFFYIKNHGVPEDIVTGARSVARAFFEQKEETKRAISLSAATHYRHQNYTCRGYQSLGANVTRYEDGFQRDWHEAIDVYYEPKDTSSKGDRVLLSPSAIHGANQWPDAHVPQLSTTMNDYVGRMNHIGAAVMRGIALGLRLADPGFFETRNGGQDPYWCMRIIHYPPLADAVDAEHASVQAAVEAKAGADGQVNAESALAGAELPRSTQLSCGEHTDYGLLTMVNQDNHVSALQGSMQVKNAGGDWITAAPIPGTFVCNIGDMMRIWTNGHYEPTLHRVANADRSRSRVSLPFFYEPAFDTVVTPIPGLHGTTSTEMLSSKHYGRHLESKVFSNFEL